MTTAHGPRRGPGVHLSTEDLSALAEGAQPGAEGAQAHLQDCAECRAEVDAVSDLLAAFAELEAPALPQDVAIRIDAALVREAAARAEAPRSSEVAATGVEHSPGTPERRESSRGRKRRGFPQGLGWGLASLALVAGGLALVVDLSSSSGTSSSGAASSSAGKAPAFAAPRNSSDAMSQPQYGATSPETLAAVSPLALWVKELLPTRAANSSTTPGPGQLIDSPCLSNPQFTGYQALAAANGTYEGTPATVVVYPNGSDTSTVYAVAYATPCSTSSYRTLAAGLVLR